MDIVFLIETKLLRSEFSAKTNSFGNCFSNSFAVDCSLSNNNRGGGLAICWTNDVNLKVNDFNDRLIDCYIECDDNLNSWRATGLYGYSKTQQKPMTCDLIANLSNTNTHDNWLLFGDFNLIRNSNEKHGGRDNHNSPSDLFNDTLTACDLNDLGYHEDIFTWSNNQEECHNIKERLDRFCASTSWMARFPRHTNYHLMNYMSDHNPILLVFGTNHDFREDSHTKVSIKRFENIWLQEQACTQIIKETWDHN
jgi:hypothetical protein